MLNVPDETARRRALDSLRRAIDLGVALGASNVRVFAGVEPEVADEAHQFGLPVDSLQALARHAAPVGIHLNVENHGGTAATSAERTRIIVDSVGDPALGILYDPANLLRLGETDHDRALELQLPYIRHVHFKDTVVEVGGRYYPVAAGTGEVPWVRLLRRLLAEGYRGFVSTEFEKRWHPERLPEPRVGLALFTAETHMKTEGLVRSAALSTQCRERRGAGPSTVVFNLKRPNSRFHALFTVRWKRPG